MVHPDCLRVAPRLHSSTHYTHYAGRRPTCQQRLRRCIVSTSLSETCTHTLAGVVVTLIAQAEAAAVLMLVMQTPSTICSRMRGMTMCGCTLHYAHYRYHCKWHRVLLVTAQSRQTDSQPAGSPCEGPVPQRWPDERGPPPPVWGRTSPTWPRDCQSYRRKLASHQNTCGCVHVCNTERRVNVKLGQFN